MKDYVKIEFENFDKELKKYVEDCAYEQESRIDNVNIKLRSF
jgi:hypothetical protein